MTLCRSDTRRKQRRVHGLQMPWHPQQVAGWLVLTSFGASTFGVLLPGLGPNVYPVVLLVLGSLFFLHLVSHVAALLIDPADPQLRAKQRDDDPKTVPELDKSKHAHVIENGKCHLCNIYTSGHRTKHCGSCNKCVEKFDHHCKWLNHCIGARNYVAFVVSVVSAVLACLVIVLVSSAELILYNVDPLQVEHYLKPIFSNRTVQVNQLFSVSRLPVDRSSFVAIATTQCIMALVALVLLLHLCLFHVYISALGITTYEYIRNYRRYPEFDSRNGASSSSLSNGDPSSDTLKSTVLSKVYASACCYRAAGATAAAGRRKRPSCGIHANLNGDDRPATSRNGDDNMAVETVESYGRGDGGLLKELETRPDDRVQNVPKCRYCLEKNRVQGNAFFVMGKRKGFCCCFRKPEPVFERTAAAAAMHHIKVPPSPFAVRRNRVIPVVTADDRRLSGGGTVVVNEWKPFNAGGTTLSTLPALPLPAVGHHRPLQKITLKELGQVLAFVEQQPLKKHRRKPGNNAAAGGAGQMMMKHSKSSSNLSPIHESGLSNPSTPQLKNRYPQTRPCSWLSPVSSSHNNSKSA